MFLLLGLGAMMLACGNVQQAANRAKKANQLKVIGIWYHNYHDANAKGPSGPQDLQQFAAEDPAALQALQAGQFVIIWNVKISDVTKSGQSVADVVLGYDSVVPSSGGGVLFVDGSVKQLTAQDFQQAPKAQPSGSGGGKR
jgi:hypothetical protein